MGMKWEWENSITQTTNDVMASLPQGQTFA